MEITKINWINISIARRRKMHSCNIDLILIDRNNRKIVQIATSVLWRRPFYFIFIYVLFIWFILNSNWPFHFALRLCMYKSGVFFFIKNAQQEFIVYVILPITLRFIDTLNIISMNPYIVFDHLCTLIGTQ